MMLFVVDKKKNH